MKTWFLILLVLFSQAINAQQDSSKVLQAVDQMEKALVAKDSVTLVKLLHPSMVFGHSNGWTQTKADVLNDMSRKFLIYEKMDRQSLSITINKKFAYVRERVVVEGNVNGTAFKLTLFVLQLWIETKKGWQLLSRQSAKQ
jgi:Domain of unknown function (DUF4440)